jgi:hypothetical protein
MCAAAGYAAGAKDRGMVSLRIYAQKANPWRSELSVTRPWRAMPEYAEM